MIKVLYDDYDVGIEGLKVARSSKFTTGKIQAALILPAMDQKENKINNNKNYFFFFLSHCYHKGDSVSGSDIWLSWYTWDPFFNFMAHSSPDLDHFCYRKRVFQSFFQVGCVRYTSERTCPQGLLMRPEPPHLAPLVIRLRKGSEQNQRHRVGLVENGIRQESQGPNLLTCISLAQETVLRL